MISFTKPKFSKTLAWLEKRKRFDPIDILNQFGREGVTALAKTTPKLTGEASGGWSYKIKGSFPRYKLVWTNNVMAGTAPLVLLLQYGHNTKSGWFLSGRDFINPALAPVYDGLKLALVREAIK